MLLLTVPGATLGFLAARAQPQLVVQHLAAVAPAHDHIYLSPSVRISALQTSKERALCKICNDTMPIFKCFPCSGLQQVQYSPMGVSGAAEKIKPSRRDCQGVGGLSGSICGAFGQQNCSPDMHKLLLKLLQREGPQLPLSKIAVLPDGMLEARGNSQDAPVVVWFCQAPALLWSQTVAGGLIPAVQLRLVPPRLPIRSASFKLGVCKCHCALSGAFEHSASSILEHWREGGLSERWHWSHMLTSYCSGKRGPYLFYFFQECRHFEVRWTALS